LKNRWENLDKKGLNKAKKIGKAAARLFARKGYLDTSMDEIATAAKISKGGMYYYFPSKTDVLFFILSNYMDLVLQDLELDLSHKIDTHEKLEFLISRHIELYSKNLHEGKVLLHEANCLPKKYSKLIVQKERRYLQIVVGILTDLLGRPVERTQIKVITFILFGMCNWIYSWYDPKGSFTPSELSDTICTIFLKGVTGYR